MARAEFVIARNPEPDSSLPYLIRLPLGEAGVVLKARETWPRTAKVYCHRADAWPERPDIVFTTIRGREGIFWQLPRTTRRSRPGVRVPGRRASGP